MGRVWLTVILPLFLPTILYVVWAVAMQRGGRAGLQRSWPWLVIAGVAFSGFVLLGAWFRSGGGGTGGYVPPHVEDGRVVPGRLVPPDAPAR